MNRQDFPRLYELRDHVTDLESAHGYVAYLGLPSLQGAILKDFREREADLQGLDDASWRYLKRELVPLLTRKDPERWWQALCDKLNEAKGYNYLVSIGCTNVQFVPRSGVQGQKTPDLEGTLVNRKVICEVKTINISENETLSRNSCSVRTGFAELPKGFFEKLKNTLEAARRQMTSYCQSPEAKTVAYVIVNYDDLLHECETGYRAQLDLFMKSNPVAGLEVRFDIKPAFYYATA